MCPAGYMPIEKAQTCIDTLQAWGLKVVVGRTLGSQCNYFSGTDAERLADLQQALDNKEVKAILCGRGGYGITRIIDKLNFKKFRKNPKWVIGYSDVTLLHLHLSGRLQVASLHSPMAAAFNDGEHNSAYILSLRQAIYGRLATYSCATSPANRFGKATGELTGGNLALIATSIGTASEIKTKGKILFIEDIGEYIYSIDRMMHQLKRSGKLSQLAGLIVGSFTDTKDTTLPFGQQVHEVITHLVEDYNYPVCFNFPVGHTPQNYALKVGAVHQLSVTGKKVLLREVRK